MKKLVKRIGKLYFLLYMLLSIAGGLTLSSCKNNIATMLEKTNEHFKAEELQYDYNLKPGDEGFEETSMLLSNYYVGTRMSLVLFAPEAVAYYWTLYSLEKTETAIWVGVDEVIKTEVKLPPSVPLYDQTFSFYVPEVPVLKPGTYELLLQVVGPDKKVYADRAQIIVYEQYYLETIEEED